jgi:hypothetical protein
LAHGREAGAGVNIDPVGPYHAYEPLEPGEAAHLVAAIHFSANPPSRRFPGDMDVAEFNGIRFVGAVRDALLKGVDSVIFRAGTCRQRYHHKEGEIINTGFQIFPFPT